LERSRVKWAGLKVTPHPQVKSLHRAGEAEGNAVEFQQKETTSDHEVALPSFPLLLSSLLLSLLSLLVEGDQDSGSVPTMWTISTWPKHHKEVVARCDICLLQGVKDPDGKAIKKLLISVNRYEHHKYKEVSSKSLGNSPADMQQYVFIYRSGMVNVMGKHQYEKKNSFVRAPYAVQFQSDKTAIKKFVLVPLHTDPSKAVQEIDRLYDVFEEVLKKWNNTKDIRLFTQAGFSWLIRDKVDTTVGEHINCAYDRIVVYGKAFLKGITPSSAIVFNYVKEFKLSKTRSSATLLQATPLLILISVSAIVQYFLSAL
ncbi:hypothetical protein F7725_001237, partial [Dissostichus mawsoni]